MEDTLRVNSSLPLPMVSCLNPCCNGRYSQSAQALWYREPDTVLILVLMEDTLREYRKRKKEFTQKVLILVLMEDTLRVVFLMHSRKKLKVLILVLMEDTLRAKENSANIA